MRGHQAVDVLERTLSTEVRSMPPPLGLEAPLPVPFPEALVRVRAALKAEGFGILSEIDIAAAFQEKLGATFRPYVILGACNPPLAYAALTADPSVGLLLPCNVTVEAAGEGASLVRVTDPAVLLAPMGDTSSPEVRRVAEDARLRLTRVVSALTAAPLTPG
jgi:uncharacterized protein (DUF302 family)